MSLISRIDEAVARYFAGEHASTHIPRCEECDTPAACEVAHPAVGPLYYCREHCPRCNIGGGGPGR